MTGLQLELIYKYCIACDAFGICCLRIRTILHDLDLDRIGRILQLCVAVLNVLLDLIKTYRSLKALILPVIFYLHVFRYDDVYSPMKAENIQLQETEWTEDGQTY